MEAFFFKCVGGWRLNAAPIMGREPTQRGNHQDSKVTLETQVFAFIVKSTQVWQLQSEKRQISHPKHTQEVQPLHVGDRVQPLYTLRLARSSSSSHEILNSESNVHIIYHPTYLTKDNKNSVLAP